MALLVLLVSAGALAQVPSGRYRCYEPPNYAVMAWFDLAPAAIAVNGDEATSLRIDHASGRIDLPPDAIPPWRLGWHFAPGAQGGDAERVTIVLARHAGQRPGTPAWGRLPRCYLTTH